jgi:hypothetical protein
MMSEELAYVAIEGRGVKCSHAVFIETQGGWHLELEDVPSDSCPFVNEQCRVTFDTWDGDHFSGLVKASYSVAGEAETYLMLSGVGELSRR